MTLRSPEIVLSRLPFSRATPSGRAVLICRRTPPPSFAGRRRGPLAAAALQFALTGLHPSTQCKGDGARLATARRPGIACTRSRRSTAASSLAHLWRSPTYRTDAMKYVSTRGSVAGLTFEQSLFSGYAADGGMLLPERIPALAEHDLARWASLSYSDLVCEVASAFISPTEIPVRDLRDVVHEAFRSFSTSDVVSYRSLGSGLNVLELFHGKTAAFKDLALCCVGSLMQYFLKRQQRHVTVLVGTSGDTGSAAIEAVRGLDNVDIIVLLPRGRCTEIQELQMTTAVADNVRVFRVDGTSDELDVPIRECFADSDYVRKHKLCSINSLNWTRIMIQIAHYFYAYFQSVKDGQSKPSRPVTVIVPTGALGNLTAGVIAWKMGLPLRLVAAVTNSTISHALDSGVYKAASLYTSHACAMNIQVPYNWERLLYLFSDGDGKMVTEFMRQFERDGSAVVPADVLAQMRLVISSHVVDNDHIVKAIQRCWHESKYLLCPHTAVAASYVYSGSEAQLANSQTVVLGVASHAKFPEVLSTAGIPYSDTGLQTRLRNLPTKYDDMERDTDWLQTLRTAIEAITRRHTA